MHRHIAGVCTLQLFFFSLAHDQMLGCFGVSTYIFGTRAHTLHTYYAAVVLLSRTHALDPCVQMHTRVYALTLTHTENASKHRFIIEPVTVRGN
jgi:hypothetical protein